ncbi:hypothetical protein GF327_03775 [Candidatus Woesearchaeota archaeon]|nr:hypothetical protein [Candidatus Woesearchaeota archaeon]
MAKKKEKKKKSRINEKYDETLFTAVLGFFGTFLMILVLLLAISMENNDVIIEQGNNFMDAVENKEADEINEPEKVLKNDNIEINEKKIDVLNEYLDRDFVVGVSDSIIRISKGDSKTIAAGFDNIIGKAKSFHVALNFGSVKLDSGRTEYNIK